MRYCHGLEVLAESEYSTKHLAIYNQRLIVDRGCYWSCDVVTLATVLYPDSEQLFFLFFVGLHTN